MKPAPRTLAHATRVIPAVAMSAAAALAWGALATAALIAVTGRAAAHDDDEKRRVDCDSATSTYEMNYCAERALEKADAKLNRVYEKTLEFVKATDGAKPYDAASWEAALRESQRAWIAFRDADCDGLTPMSWGGGTGTTVAVLDCKREKTALRTKALVAIYKGE